MYFKEERETQVFVNSVNGVTIQQQIEECVSFGSDLETFISFSSTDRIRAVANEMLRLADEIDSSK